MAQGGRPRRPLPPKGSPERGPEIYRRRRESAEARGKTGSEVRGHRPGEAERRRHREETEVLRGERGMTDRDRSRVRAWVLRLAADTDARVRDKYKDRDGVSREDAIRAFNAWWKAGGNRMTWPQFERWREAKERDRAKAYNDLKAEYARPGEDLAESVEAGIMEQSEEEFGLSLNDDLLWFIIWRSGRPPSAREDRRAA
jgi:hypothetical protein